MEGDRGGGNPGEWGRGGEREAGGDGAGCGSHVRAGEEWKTLSFLMTF